MKKVVLLLTILLCLCINYTYAQVSKTVHVDTAGQLSSLLTDEEKATITDLTITGNINSSDLWGMHRNMPALMVIDMSDAAFPDNTFPSGWVSDNQSLTSVTLPASISTYTFEAFIRCPRLTSINVPSSNLHYCSVDGVVYNKDKTKIIKCPNGKTGVYHIPLSVDTIGYNAFSNCSGLTLIDVPFSVNIIQSGAFSYCTGLRYANIPSAVTRIKSRVFEHCSGLTSIEIPPSIEYISANAFDDCSGLTSLSIPASVIAIDSDNFNRCYNLTSFSVSESNETYCSIEGVLFTKDKKQIFRYPCGKEGSYTIPSHVTSIGNCAFASCQKMNSVTLPSSVNAIGYRAFSDCSGLAEITIPTLVTEIQSGTFSGCKNLSSVTIPNSVTNIYFHAFSNCSKLKSITLPPITRIDDETFYNCTSLTSVTIPSTVVNIGQGAFRCCTGLSTIAIPSSVSTIEFYAFGYCTDVESIRVYSPIPVSFKADDWAVFEGINKESCILYVPQGSKDEYAAADQWKDFKNIIEFEYSLSLSDTTVFTAGSGGNSSFFNILSNTNWTISTDQSWLSVGNTSGTNDGMIVVTAEANPGATERTATITVSGTGVNSQTVNVSQAANNLTSISENRIETIALYPNPVSTVLFIDSAVGYEMGIYSIQGSMLLKKTLESDHESIDFSAMQPGMYLVKIGEKSYKVIK